MTSTTTTLLSSASVPLSVTPDGRYLSYVETSGDDQSLCVLDLDNGQTTLVDTYTSFTYNFQTEDGSGYIYDSKTGIDGGALSPNGAYILYSTGVTGRNIANNPGDTHIYLQDIADGAPPVDVTPVLPAQVDNVIAIEPLAIANDGLTFAYFAYDQASLTDDLFVQTPRGLLDFHDAGGGDGPTSGYDNVVQITPDGRYLTFTDGGLKVVDLQSDTSVVYGTQIGGVEKAGAISNDGRYVVYSSYSPGSNTYEIYVHDNDQPATPDGLVSASASGSAANNYCTFAALSGDGRHVLFFSAATNLVPNATDGSTNLYLKDLDSGAISIVLPDAAPPGHLSNIEVTGHIFISDDGSRVIFPDNSGNVVETTFTPPTLSVDPVTGDNEVNAFEAVLQAKISGHSSAVGQIVHLKILDNSNAVVTTAIATVFGDGSWSAAFNFGVLPDGRYTVSASVTDELTATASEAFVLDKTAPVATLTSVAGDNIINAAELKDAIVVGTILNAHPGGPGEDIAAATIQIDGGGSVTGFQTSPSGATNPQPFSQALDASGVADGEHTITLTVTDEAGNKTVVTKQVLVDTTPPKIAIQSVSGDNVVDNSEVKTAQGVNGTSDAIGQTVSVLIDGVQAGQAVVQADGTWISTISFASSLTGAHDVTAEVDDFAGNPGRADAGVYVDQGFSVQQLSVGPNGEQGGGQGVMFPGLSADGTKLVFTGLNFNLMSTAKGSSGAQVYVKDLATGAISFVTPDPSENAEFGAISANGRFVNFVTNANIDPGNPYYYDATIDPYPTPPLYFSYTTDLTTGQTYFHYVGDTGPDGTNPDTLQPGISGAYLDLGGYAAGTPIATMPVFPLAIADSGNALDLIDSIEPDQAVLPAILSSGIRGVIGGVGTSPDGSPLYGGASYVYPDTNVASGNAYGRDILQEYAPQISADGSIVAFEARIYPETWDISNQPPVVTVGLPYVPEIYAGPISNDPNTGYYNDPTPLASSFSDGTPMPFGAVDPALSGDGQFVAFWSWGTDGALQVFVKNLATGELKIASSDALGNAGVNNVVGAFAGGFNTIAISSDGRFVAFTSDAALTPDKTGAGADLFVKDMQTGAIQRVPLPSGTFNQDLSNQITMRADGGYIAFVTAAGLSPLDRNNVDDVYGVSLTSLGMAPSLAIDAVAGDNRLDAAEITKQLSIAGTSDAIGQTVSLYIDGNKEFTAAVADDGTWSGVIDATQLIDGQHSVRASVASASGATDSAGDIVTVDRIAPTFTLSTSATHLAVGDSATIKVAFSEGIGNVGAGFLTATGGTLSQIGFIDDHTLTARFTANATTFAVVANAGAAFDYAGNANVASATLTVGAGFEGYIVGGTVSYANGSGGTATTDANGAFSIGGGTGSLVLTGGVDSATGLPFTGTFTAPAGSTVLSPLTTLVQNLVATGAAASTANDAVAFALGLPRGTDLTNLDAVAGAKAGDAISTAAFLAGSQLYDALSLISAAGGSVSGALGALAADVVGGALNLVDSATIAAAATAAGLDATAASAIGSIAAATGAQLATQLASAPTPLAAFIDITGASIAEQGNAASAIATAVQGGTSLNSVADSYNAGLAGTLASSDATAANNVACYLRGTRIATARGEIAVEALRVGDFAVTAAGALRPIVWLGHRRIDATRHPDPAAVWPVVVRAGAFGAGLPRRDLRLSPGHNLACEGWLMPACTLVNGVSVEQIESDAVEYWHVELDAHDVILAEGLPAESYLDTGNRNAFANGGGSIERAPRAPCLPLALGGEPVARVKARLLARLDCEIDADADAHLMVDGERIEPMRLSERRLAFLLPQGGREIALRSRSFVPAHTTPESRDTRTLGLCVSRLEIDGVRFEPATDAAGWHPSEGAHRWTRGATRLPVGARIVVVELAGAGRYRCAIAPPPGSSKGRAGCRAGTC